MRKFLIVSNVMLLGVIFFMSCNKQDSLQPSPGERQSGKNYPGNQSTSARAECPSCYDYTGVAMQGLNSGTAYTVAQQYRNTNLELINGSFGMEDAKCVWFSLEAMENFLWKIKKASCENECPNGLRLGVRIYYGKYDEGTLGDMPYEYNGKHTVFMVPTYQDEGNPMRHWDFDPWHWGPKGCKPIPLARWFAVHNSPKPFGNQNSLLLSIDDEQYMMNPNGDVISAFNHGNMLPPDDPIGAVYLEDIP